MQRVRVAASRVLSACVVAAGFSGRSKLGLGKCRLIPSAHRYRYRTWKQQPRYRAYRARCSVLRHRRTSHLPTRLDVGVPWRVSSYAPNLQRTGALTAHARRCNCPSPLPRILRPTSLPTLHASRVIYYHLLLHSLAHFVQYCCRCSAP